MTHGVWLCSCCMCALFREEICEKNPIRFVIRLMVWRTLFRLLEIKPHTLKGRMEGVMS